MVDDFYLVSEDLKLCAILSARGVAAAALTCAEPTRGDSPAQSQTCLPNTVLQRKGGRMPIDDAAFAYLLARAGLTLTEAEKAELKTVCDRVAAIAERCASPASAWPSRAR